MVAPGIDERACWTVDPADDVIFVMQEERRGRGGVVRKVFYVHVGPTKAGVKNNHVLVSEWRKLTAILLAHHSLHP